MFAGSPWIDYGNKWDRKTAVDVVEMEINKKVTCEVADFLTLSALLLLGA